MRVLRLSLIFAGLSFGLVFTHHGWAGTFSQIDSGRWVRVDKVYDGDTFKTARGEKIRLLGINTPEIARDDHPGQPMANRAKKELESLILNKLVRLKFDQVRHDRYNRLLAHIYLQDGTWINSRMIETGMAHVYTFAPNFRHSGLLLEKERQARSKKQGIWESSRFEMLKSSHVGKSHIGQFRVISGTISAIDKSGWGFKFGNLSVSIPKAYRKWFKQIPKLKPGDFVTLHGKIRISSRERLFLALHSPFDLETIE